MQGLAQESRIAHGLLFLTCVALSGCFLEAGGTPRIAAEAVSPDGERVAFVRNHFAIDPPSQSLWLRTDGGERVKVRRLVEDQDWCDTIVWSPDSAAVAFLVQDAYLVLVNAASGEIVFEEWLIDHRGAYPPAEIVAELELSDEGATATFRRCGSRGGSCSEPETLRLFARAREAAV